jgi:tRNA pseudouridine32 synthase/23S rRNA pseudouridine746 synthase
MARSSSKSPLPLLDGVGSSSVLLPAGPWRNVIDFLQAQFPEINAAAWHSRMERGLVVDGGGVRLKADSAYVAGSFIHYYRELDAETPIPFEAEIIFQDDHLLVADKPHFLPVIPSGRFLQQTLLVRLKKHFGLEHLVPLHRIDRGTAGIVVFSTNPETRGRYQSLFPKRAVHKVYEALAPCLPGVAFPLTRRSRMVEGKPFFRMQEVAGPPNTDTQIEILERRDALCLYGLRPITGRKHQLRVHLAALGAPIVNDSFYPDLLPDAPDDYSRPLKLLARSIAFDDPVTGQHRQFESGRRL